MTVREPTEPRSKITSFWVTIAVFGSIASLIQDLLLPLAPFGIWLGYFFIVIGAGLTAVPENAKLGLLIQSITNHWKWPVVTSSFALALMLFGASYFSKSIEGERGYLADHLLIGKEIQNALLPTEKTMKEARKVTIEAHKEAIVVSESAKKIEEMSRSSVVDELNQLGIDFSNPKALWEVMENYQGDDLERVLRMMKKADINLAQRVNTWPDLAAVLGQDDVNASLLLPQYTNTVNALMMIPFEPNNLRIFLQVFPESIAIRTATTEKLAEAVIRFDPSCSDPNPPLLDHPVHPLGQCTDGVGLEGVYGVSLISYFEEQAGIPLSKIRGSYTLLHSAAAMNRAEFIPILVEFGADLNAESIAGYTALELAAERASVEAANALITAGADITHNNYRAASYALLRSRSGALGQQNESKPPQVFIEARNQPAQNRMFALGKTLLNGNRLTGVNKSVVMTAFDQVTNTFRIVVDHRNYTSKDFRRPYKYSVFYTEEQFMISRMYNQALQSLL